MTICVYHAFITCPKASELWHKIVWLHEQNNNNVNISDIEKIFGAYEKKTNVGKAILATKKRLSRTIEKGRDHLTLMLSKEYCTISSVWKNTKRRSKAMLRVLRKHGSMYMRSYKTHTTSCNFL